MCHTQGWSKKYIHADIRCIHGIFGREITKYNVIYGALYDSGQADCSVFNTKKDFDTCKKEGAILYEKGRL